MYESRFRDRVARSEFTLPAMLVVSIAVWLLVGSCVADFVDLAIGCAAICVTGYVVMEWANANALLRIRSRMITASFLALFTACPFLHAWHTGYIVLLSMALCCVFFFQAYQKYAAAAEVFHAFFFVGVASIFCPPAAYLALPLYISLLVHLRAMTLRTFAAGLLGLLTPYWMWLAYAVWKGATLDTLHGILEGFEFTAPDYSSLSMMQVVSAVLVIFYAAIATLHFMRTAFNDKIRTRMYFYVLILQEVSLLVLLLLFPEYFNTVLCLLILCAAPLIAHYFALARGRWLMNAFFVATLFLFAALCTYNYYSLWTL